MHIQSIGQSVSTRLGQVIDRVASIIQSHRVYAAILCVQRPPAQTVICNEFGNIHYRPLTILHSVEQTKNSRKQFYMIVMKTSRGKIYFGMISKT